MRASMAAFAAKGSSLLRPRVGEVPPAPPPLESESFLSFL